MKTTKKPRQTKKSNLTKKQRRLIRGRPLGTKKPRQFEETRVGHILKYEAPDEYNIIMQAVPDRSSEPPLYELIQTVTSSSNNPVFKHKRFATALEDYRVNGVYTRPKSPPTEAQLQLYAERRKKMMADMVWQNRFIISALKK